jgi:uncharacterized RDD family membrane protein YckC
MTDSGTPPNDANPYGQPPAYPQPYAQQPYAQPYGGAPYGQAGYGAPAYDYAHWIKRVGSYLLDGLFVTLAAIPAYALFFIGLGIGTQDMETYVDADGVSRTTGEWNDGGTALVVVGSLLFLVPLAFFIWNTCLRQGRTGYSLGKGILGIKLIRESDARPVGGGIAFVRQLCHILDSFCYIGFLWPLWDPKRQTFADKILSTVVINQPK